MASIFVTQVYKERARSHQTIVKSLCTASTNSISEVWIIEGGGEEMRSCLKHFNPFGLN